MPLFHKIYKWLPGIPMKLWGEYMEEKHKHKQYMEHNEKKKLKKFETATWVFGVITLILAIALVWSLTTKGPAASGVSEDDLRTKTAAYLQQLLPGQQISIDSIEDNGDL